MTGDNQQLLERAGRDVNDDTDQPTSFWRQNIKIARRIIVAVVGTTVLLFGIALILLPGPGHRDSGRAGHSGNRIRLGQTLAEENSPGHR